MITENRTLRIKARAFSCFAAFAIVTLLVCACSPGISPGVPSSVPTVPPTLTAGSPAWFSTELIDVQTKKPFTIKDFEGKVVLVETMAIWCPNCRVQEEQVKKMHELLGNPPDLVSVSLDVDLHEEQSMLAKHAAGGGFDWRFAVAPLEVERALGNLYSAQYLNPPLAPMLVIDRQGRVFGLPYGYKSAESLQKTMEPYLAQ